jgi:hypothetical protein
LEKAVSAVSDLKRLGLLRSAEGMCALATLQVVQNTGVQDFTELGSGYTDSGCAHHATDQRTGKAAQGRAHGSGDNSNGHTDSATRQGTAHASEAACDGTDCATGFTTKISGDDLC